MEGYNNGEVFVLHIRQTQLNLLNEASIIRAADTFLRERLSQDHAALGQEAVELSIRLAIRKCREHGLDYEHLFRYLNVMYTLGFRFDEDPRYSWAPAILKRPNLRPESKIDLVCARVCGELKE